MSGYSTFYYKYYDFFRKQVRKFVSVSTNIKNRSGEFSQSHSLPTDMDPQKTVVMGESERAEGEASW